MAACAAITNSNLEITYQTSLQTYDTVMVSRVVTSVALATSTISDEGSTSQAAIKIAKAIKQAINISKPSSN